MNKDPSSMLVHKAIIAKAYYELNEGNTADLILSEICDYIVTKFENRESEYPVMVEALIEYATKVAEICHSLQKVNYVKHLLPLLKYQDENLQLKGLTYDPIPLLIQYGEYTQRDLQLELDQIKKEFAQIQSQKAEFPREISSTDIKPRNLDLFDASSAIIDSFFSLFPESPDSRKPLISVPSEQELILNLSRIKIYADLLGSNTILQEINSLHQFESIQPDVSITENKALIEQQEYQFFYPMERNFQVTTFKPSEGETPRIKPETIIEAHKQGNIAKVNTLILQYEKMLYDDESDKPYSLIKADDEKKYIPPSEKGESVWISIKKIKLAKICLKVNKLMKAKSLLGEIWQIFEQKGFFKEFGRYNPTCSPLGLFRQSISLMVQCQCNQSEIKNLINFVVKNDPKALPFLGLTFVKNGMIEKAQEILEICLTPSKGFNINNYDMRRYFEKKMEILAELGETTEAAKIHKKIERSIQQKDSPSSPADIMTGHTLQEALMSSNLGLINSALNECIPTVLSSGDFLNDFDRFHFEPLKPLLQKKPLKGVKEEFRKEIQEILCEILLEILEQPTSIKQIGNTGIIRALYLLLGFDRHKEVKKYTEYFLAMVQEALEKFAPSDLKKDLSLVPFDISPWSYENALKTDLNRTAFRYLAQIDFWTCFQETNANPYLNYSQFNTTYQRWYGEARSGDLKNSFLFVNIPLSYMYILPICAKLEETKFISVYAKNMTVLQNKRHSIVAEEPVANIHDQDWYSNIFSNISQQMRALLQYGDYETAKECLDHTLELLFYEGVHIPDHIGKILRIFDLITEY